MMICLDITLCWHTQMAVAMKQYHDAHTEYSDSSWVHCMLHCYGEYQLGTWERERELSFTVPNQEAMYQQHCYSLYGTNRAKQTSVYRPILGGMGANCNSPRKVDATNPCISTQRINKNRKHFIRVYCYFFLPNTSKLRNVGR